MRTMEGDSFVTLLLLPPKLGGIRGALLPIVTAALALAIFIFDTSTELEIAAAALYVVVVLLSLGFCRRLGVLTVSALCVLLTFVSHALTPSGDYNAGLINTIISLSAIGATTYLALAIDSARAVAFEAQAQLAHIARVTTLGELVASIAHEVNQPLSAIVTNANACARWIDAQPPNLDKAASSIRDIVGDANRASEIIGHVRKLTTRSAPTRDWVNINDAIEEILGLMQRQLQEHRIIMRANLGKDVSEILGDRIQLQQVVLNLVLNAIDSIKRVSKGDRTIFISTSNSSNSGTSEVLVSVQDAGGGIEPQTEARLFEAFHSTKPGGMGMGLTICRSIVEAHGGRIWATKPSQSGAVFQFSLPKNHPEAA